MACKILIRVSQSYTLNQEQREERSDGNHTAQEWSSPGHAGAPAPTATAAAQGAAGTHCHAPSILHIPQTLPYFAVSAHLILPHPQHFTTVRELNMALSHPAWLHTASLIPHPSSHSLELGLLPSTDTPVTQVINSTECLCSCSCTSYSPSDF